MTLIIFGITVAVGVTVAVVGVTAMGLMLAVALVSGGFDLTGWTGLMFAVLGVSDVL